jgi:hypothetical protein
MRSLDSLLDREETSSALLAPAKEKAFVWGVDINYDDDDDEEGEKGGEEKNIQVISRFRRAF